MGAIEDARQVLQDFIAPELRGIAERVSALEHEVRENECRAEKRHDEVMSALRQVLDYNPLAQRVSRLEQSQQQKSAH